jgi:hypothetical protein
MSTRYGPRIVTDGLVLYLDARNPKSYQGSGTIWYDISGNNNHFNIVEAAFQNDSSGKYMDFRGSYGCAKNAADITLSDATGVTYLLWTKRILKPPSTWRTLTRSYVSDHHVMIYAGGTEIGVYDNATGWVGSGYQQSSLPNYDNEDWIFLHWRWQNVSPYYEMSYNDSPNIIRASISNSNSRYERGFGSIGAYHNNNTSPSSASQFWGDIGVFQVYNRRLSDNEILQNYVALRR